MTGEDLGHAADKLMSAGALDVFTTPVSMKKGRPAVLLTVLCKEDMREELLRLIFRYTSTIGVREHLCSRYVLERTEETVSTKYGDVRVKKSAGYGVSKYKYEHDDLARIADEQGISIEEVRNNI